MKQFSACLVLVIWSCSLCAWSQTKPLRTLNLEQLGYQHLTCEVYWWKGEDGYPKQLIEFLDNTHLVVHFATPDVCIGPAIPWQKRGLRSVVIDLSGHVVHTYDWEPGEDVIAGPDAHILIVRVGAVEVVDFDFQPIQTIPYQQQGFAGASHPDVRLFRVVMTPSRHGFAIVDRGYAILLTGPVYEQKVSTTDSVAAVTDDGFVGFSGFNPGPPNLHVDGVQWVSPTHPQLSSFIVVGENKLLGLDHKFNLYRFDPHGTESLVARLGSLAPGMWNSGFHFAQALPETRRVLFASEGVRIAFTDSSGFWTYFRTALLDLKSNEIMFRYNGHFGGDVSISPDGHTVAARHEGRLTLYSVP